MKPYYIPHKLSVGDITNLSDSQSELIISQKLHKVEDLIKVQTLNAVFRAIITDISTASVEVEIMEKLSEAPSEKSGYSITLLQALSGDRKFNTLLEKAVEIGVETVIPLETEYTTLSQTEAAKRMNNYRNTVKDAAEQSRNSHPTVILDPIHISRLSELNFTGTEKICLATENIQTRELTDAVSKAPANFVVAIGPETGWSSSDLQIFTNLGFKFIRLKGNILRTETAGIVISSIISYLNREI